MPTLAVLVDGVLIASVRTDGLDVLAIHLGGTKVDAPLATLDCHGGTYPETADSTHRVWIGDHVLMAGQCVRVEVTEDGTTRPAGKTLEELFPEEPRDERGAMPSREQLVQDIRARPRVRDHLTLGLRSSFGHGVRAEVGPDEHGFGASFLWNGVQPGHVCASLHTFTLEQLLTRKGFNDHFREQLEPDSWVEVRVDVRPRTRPETSA